MTQISIGEAVGAGFRVVRREPKAVLVWGLVHLAMYAVLMAFMAAFFAQIWNLADEPQATEPDVSSMIALQLQMMGFQPVFMLGVYGVQVLLMAAVFRSVLQPEDRRWGYLRFSGQELWLALVYVVISFGLSMVASMLMLPLAGVGALIGMASYESFGPWGVAAAVAPIVLAGIAALVWLSIRLCMALPMSFEDRTFRLFESWTLTRGQTRPLFLMFLTVLLIAFGIQILFSAAVLGLLAAMAAPHWDTLMDGDLTPLLTPGGVILGLGAIGGCLLAGVVTALTTAPLAQAYRQLRPAPPTAAVA